MNGLVFGFVSSQGIVTFGTAAEECYDISLEELKEIGKAGLEKYIQTGIIDSEEYKECCAYLDLQFSKKTKGEMYAYLCSNNKAMITIRSVKSMLEIAQIAEIMMQTLAEQIEEASILDNYSLN